MAIACACVRVALLLVTDLPLSRLPARAPCVIFTRLSVRSDPYHYREFLFQFSYVGKSSTVLQSGSCALYSSKYR